MIIRLSENKGEIPFDFAAPSESLDISLADVSFFGDVRVKGIVDPVGGEYVARGTIEVNKRFECDRCLKEVEASAQIPFEEKFANYETEDSTLFADDEIDLTEAVRDTILSSEPIGHLCGKDCKGLCKICGKDLNEGDCGCDRRIPDPRLSVLDNLKI